MLAAEALRLAAVEVLCPTAALLAGGPFPTLAGRRVFDSRAAEIDDLDETLAYTPVLALYSRSARMASRGDAADGDDHECQAVLEIVGELAVAAGEGGDPPFADALAGSDPEGRLVLAAMMAQVRFLLEFSQSGALFRDMRIAVRQVEEETMALPEYGLRWQRIFMRITAAVPDDSFDIAAGGLPEPIGALLSRLPENSYAKTRLAALAAHFAADPRPALEGTTIAPAFGDDPIASTGDL